MSCCDLFENFDASTQGDGKQDGRGLPELSIGAEAEVAVWKYLGSPHTILRAGITTVMPTSTAHGVNAQVSGSTVKLQFGPMRWKYVDVSFHVYLTPFHSAITA